MQGDGPERCSHTLDPEQWEREHDEPCQIDPEDDADILETGDGRQVWRCPHPAIEGHAECVFHLPPEKCPEDADSAEEFLAIVDGERDALDGDGRRPPQFVEATFGDLDIERERFGADETIDLRHARIGRMVWEVERVDVSIDASGAVIEDRCECEAVTFQSGAHFSDTHFRDDVRFADPNSDLEELFRGTTFDAGATFDGWAYFGDATFDGRAFFLNSVLKESVFTSAVFNDGATFRTDLSEMVFPVSVFQGPADFSGATAQAGIDFRITDGDRIVSEDLPNQSPNPSRVADSVSSANPGSSRGVPIAPAMSVCPASGSIPGRRPSTPCPLSANRKTIPPRKTAIAPRP